MVTGHVVLNNIRLLRCASCAQIGAWVSDQSEPIASREKMRTKAKEIEVSNPPVKCTYLLNEYPYLPPVFI